MTAPATIQLSDIALAKRLRKEYNRIPELAESLSVMGTIQPIVLRPSNEEDATDKSWVCVAGGRRFTAMKSLAAQTLHHGATSDPYRLGFVLTSDLPLDVAREIELEENLQRESMTWAEVVFAIEEIHNLKSRKAALSGEAWGSRETGRLLGKSHVSVHYALLVAKELRADPELAKLDNPTAVLKVIADRKADELLRHRATLVGAQEVEPTVDPIYNEEGFDDETRDQLCSERPVQNPNPTLRIALSSMLHHGDAMQASVQPGSVHHIITDPPYGIDMGMFIQDVSRVEDTHDVQDNIKMFGTMFTKFYAALAEQGFCVLWCDQANWHTLYTLATNAGFAVQRWPLVWCKTSSCANQAAQYNFTKRTEIAMVCRKPKSTLATTQSANYFVSGLDAFCANSSNPFSKPLDLWKWVIEAVSYEGQTVWDPFAGEGSCPVACLQAGRKILAHEIDEAHYNRMRFNVEQHFQMNKPTNTNLHFT